MRKYLIWIVACVLVTALVLSLVGCGGDTSKAKELMKKGDETLRGAAPDAQEFGTKIEALLADLNEKVSSGQAPDKATFDQEVAAIRGLAGEIGEVAKEAKAEYEKIKSLKGVEDYVEYADLMIQAIDSGQEVSKFTIDFLDEVAGLVASPSLDLAAITQSTTKFNEEVMEMSEKNVGLQEEAMNLKEEKKLE